MPAVRAWGGFGGSALACVHFMELACPLVKFLVVQMNRLRFPAFQRHDRRPYSEIFLTDPIFRTQLTAVSRKFITMNSAITIPVRGPNSSLVIRQSLDYPVRNRRNRFSRQSLATQARHGPLKSTGSSGLTIRWGCMRGLREGSSGRFWSRATSFWYLLCERTRPACVALFASKDAQVEQRPNGIPGTVSP